MSKLVVQDGGRNVSLDHVELTERALEVGGGALYCAVEGLECSGMTGFLSHGRLKW